MDKNLPISVFSLAATKYMPPTPFFHTLPQLNPDINVFQRKFVNEVRRCEEMDRKLSRSLNMFTFQQKRKKSWELFLMDCSW